MVPPAGNVLAITLIAFMDTPQLRTFGRATNQRGQTMPPNAPTVIAPIPTTVLSSAIDRLKDVHIGPRRRSELLALVAKSVGRDEREQTALFARLIAAAIVFRDPRWAAWRAYFRSCDASAHRQFDDLVLDLFATLPLELDLRFSGDDFFDQLLARVNARDRN